jgi:hypothetical protein
MFDLVMFDMHSGAQNNFWLQAFMLMLAARKNICVPNICIRD